MFSATRTVLVSATGTTVASGFVSAVGDASGTAAAGEGAMAATAGTDGGAFPIKDARCTKIVKTTADWITASAASTDEAARMVL